MAAFRLLEINLISAFDLEVPRSFDPSHDRIYAVVWINPNHKFKSSTVQVSNTNPKAWNERFVFVVDAKTLNSLTTAHFVVELYSVGKKRDVLLGTSRVLLGTFGNCDRYYSGMSTGTFREFHVRRPNGVARGVLNVGITILNGLTISV